jgi:hypothetical protein
MILTKACAPATKEGYYKGDGPCYRWSSFLDKNNYAHATCEKYQDKGYKEYFEKDIGMMAWEYNTICAGPKFYQSSCPVGYKEESVGLCSGPPN